MMKTQQYNEASSITKIETSQNGKRKLVQKKILLEKVRFLTSSLTPDWPIRGQIVVTWQTAGTGYSQTTEDQIRQHTDVLSLEVALL